MIPILIQILLILLLTVLVSIWANSRARCNLPPGPSPILPFVGNLLQMAKFRGNKASQSKLFQNLQKAYGPICFLQLGRIKLVLIQDLELAKEHLCSEIWVDRPFDDLISERSFGRQLGIIFTSGEVWKEMRRFTMRTLRDFGFGKQKSMESVLEEEVGFIHQTINETMSQDKEVLMRQFFSLPVLNALWSMVAGSRFDYSDPKGKKLVSLVDETSRSDVVKQNLLTSLPLLWRLAKFSPKRESRRHFIKTLQDFFRDILLERRQLGTYKEEPKDFIDAFLQEIDLQKDKPSQHLFTDDQFIMVCFDLFIAGADTTSNTLEFAILYMILNPECQRKVQQEIDSVLGVRIPNWADRSKMPYTEATILETQRMACVLPVVVRRNIQPTRLLDYDIPQGTYCTTSIYNIHYSTSVWEDPTQFRPERFLDQTGKIVVNANKIIPFGLGKRVCLGEVLARASLFSYFTSLLQRYSISASPNHAPPTSVPFEGFTLSPRPYHAVFTPR